MKSTSVLVFLVFAFSFMELRAQNYLDNGGFENYKSNVDATSGCGTSGMPEDCTPTVNSLSYYSNCPGGYASVSKELQNWVDRGGTPSFTSSCSFCAPHSPDWIYNNYYHGPGGNFFTPQFGNSCIGAAPFELFQQNFPTHVKMAGNYMLSAWIKSSTSTSSYTWLYNNYDIQFILSHNQPTFSDESCDGEQNNTSGYKTLSNKDRVFHKDLDKSSPITDWTLIEFPFTVTSGQEYSWFSVNMDAANTEIQPPYMVFDEIYLADEQCYCPLVRDYTDASLSSGYTHIGAQEYLYVGPNVTVNNGASALFTAGSAVTVLPGFNVTPGGVAEIKLGGCFDNTPESSAFVPNPYSTCWGANGEQICIHSKNITEMDVSVTDVIGQVYFDETSMEVNTSVYNTNGDNVTCISLNSAIENQDVIVRFNGTGCNGGSVNFSTPIYISCDGKKEGDYQTVTEFSSAITLSPNPFCTTVSVKNPSAWKNDEIEIFDSYGKLIWHSRVLDPETQIDMSKCENGIYFLLYIGSSSTTTKKLIKACDY